MKMDTKANGDQGSSLSLSNFCAVFEKKQIR